MSIKTKRQSLAEFTASIPPGQRGTVPIESITKEEYWSLMVQDMPVYLTELAAKPISNRDLIIETVGILDIELTKLLKSAVLPDATERLFSRNGKIKDLEAKIELAFGLGLLSQDDRQVLNALRDIRNKFAHDASLHYFEHDPKVMGKLHSLAKFNTPGFPARLHICTLAISLFASLNQRRESIAPLAKQFSIT